MLCAEHFVFWMLSYSTVPLLVCIVESHSTISHGQQVSTSVLPLLCIVISSSLLDGSTSVKYIKVRDSFAEIVYTTTCK